MKRALISIVAVFLASFFALTCAAEDSRREGGLFSEGSFLSDTISSATSKLNTVTSGRERIVDDNAKGIPQDTLEYDGDPLGRPLVKPSFRKKQRDADSGIQ